MLFLMAYNTKPNGINKAAGIIDSGCFSLAFRIWQTPGLQTQRIISGALGIMRECFPAGFRQGPSSIISRGAFPWVINRLAEAGVFLRFLAFPGFAHCLPIICLFSALRPISAYSASSCFFRALIFVCAFISFTAGSSCGINPDRPFIKPPSPPNKSFALWILSFQIQMK